MIGYPRKGKPLILEDRMKFKFISLALAASLTLAAGAQKLTGAGATFPNPIYSRWFTEYRSTISP